MQSCWRIQRWLLDISLQDIRNLTFLDFHWVEFLSLPQYCRYLLQAITSQGERGLLRGGLSHLPRGLTTLELVGGEEGENAGAVDPQK